MTCLRRDDERRVPAPTFANGQLLASYTYSTVGTGQARTTKSECRVIYTLGIDWSPPIPAHARFSYEDVAN